RTHSPGASRTHSPGASRTHSPGASRTHSPGASRTHSPGASRTHSPGASRTHSPGARQTGGEMAGASRPTHSSMTRVKICGITNLEDAMTAVEAGADALGFIFVENTPRFVTPDKVAPIVRALPPFVTTVGIFWDHPAGHIKAVQEECGLGALQFHGDE